MNYHHPEIFQGFHQTNHYFEGWYFKFVSKDLKTSLALIPGISIHKETGHAFIQVFLARHGDQPSLKTYYIRFKQDDFIAEKEFFSVKIGESTFSSHSVHVHLKEDDLSLELNLQLNNLTPINTGFLSPSIMGPFAYLPRMECNHGIVSLNHSLTGTCVYQGESIEFTGGKGYLEKDWGTSFPEKYVWVQSNHFKEDDVSFFFSYATIPYLGLKFNGLICHLYVKGKHYRFATYNQARIIKEKVDKTLVHYVIKKGKLMLEFTGSIDHVVDLPSPKHGSMNQSIKEGLSGKVNLTLKEHGNVIYSGKSLVAGIEIMK